MTTITAPEAVGHRTARCHALDVSPATMYRAAHGVAHPRMPSAPRASARALSLAERAAVCALLHAERFVDLAPAQVYATRLDEAIYHRFERTMYRILADAHEVRARRAQRRHPVYTAPELLATAPNQVWSWDITTLRGPTPGVWYHRYVVLEVCSCYVVRYLGARKESAALATRLLGTCCLRQGIARAQLTIHADRGAAMTSKPVALLRSDLGITTTHSRSHVSSDNPYAEAHVTTLKYRPDYPDRFGSLEDARAHRSVLFPWYNTGHRHTAPGLHTPHEVHYGLATARNTQRAVVLSTAYAATPERFVKRPPTPAPLPTAAWINPPKPVTAVLAAQ